MPPPPVLRSTGVTSPHTSAGPLLVQDANTRDIQYAMSNPANPRTHGNSTPYRNPFQSRRTTAEVDENDVSTFHGHPTVTYFAFFFNNIIATIPGCTVSF